MLTQQELKKLLRYDPISGDFRRLTYSQNNQFKPGDVAGAVNRDGYKIISINGKKYAASRLVWLYTTGKFPSHKIVFKDGNRANTALSNLSTKRQTKTNRPAPEKTIQILYEITHRKVKNRHYITIDGIEHTIPDIVKRIGLSYNSIAVNINKPHGLSWLRKKLFLHKNKLSMNMACYCGPDYRIITAADLCRKCNLTSPEASTWGQKFEREEITWEEMLAYWKQPKKTEKLNGSPNWQGLSNKLRDYNLKNIPSPTKYEREELEGVYSGGPCLPSSTLAASLVGGDRRY